MKPNFLYTLFLIMVFASLVSAQDPAATPPGSADDLIKISTDEIHLNVLARSSESGQFVPTLKAEDLLVVEDGTPQDITSFKRVPANVLLLLDTGADLNFVKSAPTTRLIAEIFVRSLPPGNLLSVAQYYDKVETISEWNEDYKQALDGIAKKLFTGKRARFAEALNAAVENFKSRPLENRHLVIISDGVESVAEERFVRESLQKLRAANITVHVMSYTQLEEQKAQKATQKIRRGDGKTKPRIDPFIYDQILRGMPAFGGVKDVERLRTLMKQMNEAQALVIVNLDFKRNERIDEKRHVWKEAETNLQTLADDTGGIFQAPEDMTTLYELAGEIARGVDSQYVITYMSKKPFQDSQDRESRRVRVSSRCEGIEIKSRQKIVINLKQIK